MLSSRLLGLLVHPWACRSFGSPIRLEFADASNSCSYLGEVRSSSASFSFNAELIAKSVGVVWRASIEVEVVLAEIYAVKITFPSSGIVVFSASLVPWELKWKDSTDVSGSDENHRPDWLGTRAILALQPTVCRTLPRRSLRNAWDSLFTNNLRTLTTVHFW